MLTRSILSKSSLNAGVVAAALIFGVWQASAVPFSFVEDFEPFDAGTNPDGLTPGTDTGPHLDWENGFLNGDNGWIVIEGVGSGSQNFGQRDASGVTPGGAFSGAANVRMRGGVSAFAIQDFSATPLISGNVTLDLSDALANLGLGTSQMEIRLAVDGGATDALRLRIGNVTDVFSSKFEVVQIGGACTVVADTSTTAIGGADLKWWNTLSTTDGDYVTLSIDFDTVTDSASVVITTTDHLGVSSSTAPVVVAFANAVSGIERLTLNTLGPSNGHGTGSLTYIDNLSITGTVVPEPASLALLSLGGLLMLTRKR